MEGEIVLTTIRMREACNPELSLMLMWCSEIGGGKGEDGGLTQSIALSER